MYAELPLPIKTIDMKTPTHNLVWAYLMRLIISSSPCKASTKCSIRPEVMVLGPASFALVSFRKGMAGDEGLREPNLISRLARRSDPHPVSNPALVTLMVLRSSTRDCLIPMHPCTERGKTTVLQMPCGDHAFNHTHPTNPAKTRIHLWWDKIRVSHDTDQCPNAPLSPPPPIFLIHLLLSYPLGWQEVIHTAKSGPWHVSCVITHDGVWGKRLLYYPDTEGAIIV